MIIFVRTSTKFSLFNVDLIHFLNVIAVLNELYAVKKSQNRNKNYTVTKLCYNKVANTDFKIISTLVQLHESVDLVYVSYAVILAYSVLKTNKRFTDN